MKRVFICSPYRGDVARNVEVARAACRDVALAGDAPLAVHLYLPGALNDDDRREREIGLFCGLAWLGAAHEVLVVGEPTVGMRREIEVARRLGIAIRGVAP